MAEETRKPPHRPKAWLHWKRLQPMHRLPLLLQRLLNQKSTTLSPVMATGRRKDAAARVWVKPPWYRSDHHQWTEG